MSQSQSSTYVRAFYAEWDPGSRERCLAIREALDPHPVELCEIGTRAAEWAATGMRTIPAFEVFVDGRPVRTLSGPVEADALHAALADGAGGEPRPARIEPLEVVSSTGSYRYDRWGEHFLTEYSRPDTGWSSPTRREAEEVFEELVVDALAPHRIVRVGLTPRPWERDAAYRTRFPSDFAVDASDDGHDWSTVLRVEGFAPEAPTPRYWDVDAEARYLRLTITGVPAQGKPRRYMCQIMKFEAWGERLDPAGPPRLSGGRWDRTAGPWEGTVEKLGLQFEDGPATASVWHFPPGAALPPRRRPGGRGRLIGLAGRAAVEDSTSGDARELAAGEWVAYGPEATIVVRNRSDSEPAAVLELATFDAAGEVWT